MEQNVSAEKQELHELVDQLAPGEIQTAKRSLEYLTLQPDDEPYPASQQQRDLEAVSEIERGNGIPHEDILRDFGM